MVLRFARLIVTLSAADSEGTGLTRVTAAVDAEGQGQREGQDEAE